MTEDKILQHAEESFDSIFDAGCRLQEIHIDHRIFMSRNDDDSRREVSSEEDDDVRADPSEKKSQDRSTREEGLGSFNGLPPKVGMRARTHVWVNSSR